MTHSCSGLCTFSLDEPNIATRKEDIEAMVAWILAMDTTPGWKIEWRLRRR